MSERRSDEQRSPDEFAPILASAEQPLIVPQYFTELYAEHRAGTITLENLVGAIRYCSEVVHSVMAGNVSRAHHLDFRQLLPRSFGFASAEIQAAAQQYLVCSPIGRNPEHPGRPVEQRVFPLRHVVSHRRQVQVSSDSFHSAPIIQASADMRRLSHPHSKPGNSHSAGSTINGSCSGPTKLGDG